MRLLVATFTALVLFTMPVAAKVPEVGQVLIFDQKRLACSISGVMRIAFAGTNYEVQDFRNRVNFVKILGLCFQEEPMTPGLVVSVSQTPLCVVEFRDFSMSAWELNVRFSEHYTVALLWLEPLEEA